MEQILPIIKDAQAYLKSNGVDQWQDGFPNLETLTQDITSRESFLLYKNDEPVAFEVLSFEREELYHNPLEGSLKLKGKYATLHRTAVKASARGKGISHFMFDFAAKYSKASGIKILRIDTHKDNKVMQHIIAREGFTYCELVTLLPGVDRMKRLVFEKEI